MFFVNDTSQKIINKWKLTGLLYGLDDAKSSKMAGLLENTAQWVVLEQNENFVDLVFPILIRVFSQIDFDLCSAPVYLNGNNAVTTEIYDTGCEISIFSTKKKDELDEVTKVSDELIKFFNEKINSGFCVMAYTPFIYNAPNNNGKCSIMFRGNLLKSK